MDRTVAPVSLIVKNTASKLFDVRRRADLEASNEQLQDAIWLDPADVANWSHTLVGNTEIVVYCVRGGSVSNAVIDALHAQGVNARYIEGGIEGWKAAGGVTVPRK